VPVLLGWRHDRQHYDRRAYRDVPMSLNEALELADAIMPMVRAGTRQRRKDNRARRRAVPHVIPGTGQAGQ
jgi:hypothetical protein